MIYPIYFSALLKSQEGRLMEVGEACLSRTENKVTFKNEFVPLVKLDTMVEVVRVLGNKQLERFQGRVYLSSRNLLQIVDVNEKIITDARSVFDINTYHPAVFTLSPNDSPRFNPKKAEVIDGTIRYLSKDVIKLSVLPFVAEGQYLTVECEPPPELKKAVLRVERRELLGRQAALLICSVVSIPTAEEESLAACWDVLSKLAEDVDAEAMPPDPIFREIMEEGGELYCRIPRDI